MFAKYKFYIIGGLAALGLIYWFFIRKKKDTTVVEAAPKVFINGTEDAGVWDGHETARTAWA